MHRLVQPPNGPHRVRKRAGPEATGGKHDEGLLHVRRGAGGLRQERRPLLDGAPELVGAVGVPGQIVPGVLHAERHVARFIDPSPTHDVGGHGVRRVSLHEREIVQERTLAEDGQ